MRFVRNELGEHRYFYLAILTVALLMMLTLPVTMQGADGKEYLRWTHSLVFDQDLHLLNNLEAVGGGYKLTPTGYTFERVNIGTAVMWAPFYGAGSLFLWPTFDDAPYPGRAKTQLIWLNFSSWLYPILGGILTVGALRRFFPGRLIGFALVAVLFGTPVLFYMMTFPMSAHPALIFLSALLLYLWLSNKPGREFPARGSSHPPAPASFLHYTTVGVVIGWLMLVASYNVVFLVLPGFDLLRELVTGRNWKAVFQNGLAVAVGGLVGFLPQMIVFWLLFGNPLYSPYSGQLFWTEPYLLETLFSTFHGLFFYAPLLLLVFPGLWWWWRRQNSWIAASIALVWLLLAYIVSINVAWWAGASFGNRYFLTLTPFFLFGLAAFIQSGKKWGLILMTICVLWTIGLYLQFLNGVGFTSDSIVYPAMDLMRGQLVAWANLPPLLPRLLLERPWHLVSRAVLPVLLLVLIIVSRVVYGRVVVKKRGSINRSDQLVLLGCGLGLLLFIGLAGFRGEQAKAALAAQGFFNQPHQVIRREVKEVAGKAGLATRALYHRQTGQPDKAAADLRLASRLWKREGGQPARLYLGPSQHDQLLSEAFLLESPLNYPGDVRLLGYQILEASPQAIKGELFWEKRGDRSKMAVTPIVRAFDQTGELAGRTVVDFPFPADYIPAGDLFKDSFYLELDPAPDRWIWLDLSLMEDFALPVNDSGETANGFLGSVPVDPSLRTPFLTSEASPGLVAKPLILTGNVYQSGQMIPLQLVWQRKEKGSREGVIALTLLDSNRRSVAEARYPLEFAANRLVFETGCFSLPPTLPTGDYQLEFELYPDSDTRLLDEGNRPVDTASFPLQLTATDTSSEQTTICNLLQANFPRRYYHPSKPQREVDVRLTDEIRLAGYDLTIVPQTNSVLATVILHLQVRANVAYNYRVSLQLVDDAGQLILHHAAIPVYQTRPTSTWLEDEWILDQHNLEVPPLPAGNYQLTLALVDEQSGRPVETELGRSFVILESLQIP